MTEIQAQAPSKGAFSLNKLAHFSKQDFTEMFASAPRRHGRFFTLFYDMNTRCDRPRFGVVVAKKNAGTCVRRNLVKRLVREHFRLAQPDVMHQRLLFLSKKGVDLASRHDLHQDLDQLFLFLKKAAKSS